MVLIDEDIFNGIISCIVVCSLNTKTWVQVLTIVYYRVSVVAMELKINYKSS